MAFNPLTLTLSRKGRGNYKLKNIDMHFKYLIILLFVLIFISGCATSDDVGRVQWEINDIRSEISALRAKTEAGLSAENVLADIEESQKTTARSVADMYMKTQELSKEIQRVTGRLEEVQNSADKSIKDSEQTTSEINRIKSLLEEMEKRLAKLETPPPAVNEKKEEETKPVQPEEERKAAALPEVKDVYMAAYELYKAGKMKEAREAFVAMLKDYPENEYSDNARFWIAESYYKDDNYEEAILAYEELVKKNPESEKIPGAMLKQGLAFYALKDAKTGKLILERLIERYPDAEESKSAKKKLKESTSSKKKR
jgi:tol-pal system protein YbgF